MYALYIVVADFPVLLSWIFDLLHDSLVIVYFQIGRHADVFIHNFSNKAHIRMHIVSSMALLSGQWLLLLLASCSISISRSAEAWRPLQLNDQRGRDAAHKFGIGFPNNEAWDTASHIVAIVKGDACVSGVSLSSKERFYVFFANDPSFSCKWLQKSLQVFLHSFIRFDPLYCLLPRHFH